MNKITEKSAINKQKAGRVILNNNKTKLIQENA
jgi:hypothetical protein